MNKFNNLSRNEFLLFMVNNVLLVTLVILPLVFLPFKGIKDIYSGPRYVFLLLITIIVLITLAFNPKEVINRISLSKANVLILIFFLILTISLSYSINVYLSLYGFSIWRDGYIVQSIFIILYFLAQLSNKLNKNLFIYIVISASIVSIYGIAQSFGFDFIKGFNPKGLPVFSTMYNQNFLGTYLVLILPIVIHQIFNKNNYLYLIAYGLLFYTLLETQTRGAWLGFIVSFFVYFVLYARTNGINQINRKKVISIVIISFILLVIFDLRSGGVFLSRFTSIFKEANLLLANNDIDKIGSNRGYIWAKSIEYIMKRPLFGYGIQNIILYFIADYQVEMKTLFGEVLLVNNVHNEYLQIAISTGIPSLLFYLAFLFQSIKSGLKKISQNPVYIPIIASIIGYLIQAFFSLSFISVAYIFWIFIGILNNKNDIFN